MVRSEPIHPMMPRYIKRMHAWISGARASPKTLERSPVAIMPKGSWRNMKAFMNVKASRATPVNRIMIPLSWGLLATDIGMIEAPCCCVNYSGGFVLNLL